MSRVTVIRPFHDLVEDVDRRKGDVFEATDGRARQLVRVLPSGYVDVEHEQTSMPDPAPAEKPADDSTDLSVLTVAELRALASKRGVELPKRASKATILKILEG